MSAVKILSAIVLIVLYAALSHTALAAQDMHSIWRQLAASVLLASLLGVLCWSVASLLKQAGMGGGARLFCTVLAGGLAACGIAVLWPVLLQRLAWMYLVEHVATNGLLCWFFAHTLFGGRTPVVTTLARAIHGELPDAVVRYTRTVTLAWALFFAAQVVVSICLFNAASIETWSVFANVLNWPLVVLMFVVEYAFRRRVTAGFQHATIRQSVAAYFDNRHKI